MTLLTAGGLRIDCSGLVRDGLELLFCGGRWMAPGGRMAAWTGWPGLTAINEAGLGHARANAGDRRRGQGLRGGVLASNSTLANSEPFLSVRASALARALLPVDGLNTDAEPESSSLLTSSPRGA